MGIFSSPASVNADIVSKALSEGGESAAALSKAVNEAGLSSLGQVSEELKKALGDKQTRAGALDSYRSLCELGYESMPWLIPFASDVIRLCAEKDVRDKAQAAADALDSNMGYNSIKNVLPELFKCMTDEQRWQVKEVSLKMLSKLAEHYPESVSACLPEIVPAVTQTMSDLKKAVAEAAKDAMQKSFSAVGNRDIEPFVPSLVLSVNQPDKVADCIHGLAGTTFVQQVEAPTLSIISPLLQRGLKDRSTPIKRKSAVIIENMCKLIEDERDAKPFLPKLLPGLNRNKEEVADPECRNVTAKAHSVLLKSAGGHGVSNGDTSEEANVTVGIDVNKTQSILKSAIGKQSGESASEVDSTPNHIGPVMRQAAAAASCLIGRKHFDSDEWSAVAVGPLLKSITTDEMASRICEEFRSECYEETKEKQDDHDDEPGDDLCDCEFSLAYGAKILLNNARLHLKTGARYGLCGQNGCGKSTLMGAIANDQLDGFPSDRLRTVYVAHDIQGADTSLKVVEFILADPLLQNEVTEEKVHSELSNLGFTEEMLAKTVTALSGGWKMKLALGRAMLYNADILLLDEPTNHLDQNNVKWLNNFLCSQQRVTSIIVSHDSKFLDNVCTGIIHFEGRKMRKYLGNLSEFVRQVPEAQSYYSFEASNLTFKFPEPGYLEGVKNKDKAILKIRDATFQYPGTNAPQIKNASLQCSLSSRVACIGPNGAGKSTLIKLLCGELEPDTGYVWRHQNMRIAYVAQHAFHHLEKHLNKSPNEYIQWRYSAGDDKEANEKITRQFTKEEEEKMKQPLEVKINDVPQKVVIEKILGRRQQKGKYEYECQFVKRHPDDNTFVDSEKLKEAGWGKVLAIIDEREAMRQSLYQRPLTQKNVEKHLEDVGLEAEFGTHAQLRSLSGGQKVKVVIAAAMWNNPHLLIMDEPTNYLDRDALGALASAIKAYEGGVLLISHNHDFTRHLCPETWNVDGGELAIEGNQWVARSESKMEQKQVESYTDALGNTVEVKEPKKKLSRKELKAKKKMKEAARARGESVSDEEDDFADA